MKQFSSIDTALAVLRKELTDIVRDPRTLILSVALPLILFPLLFWILSQEKPAVTDEYAPYRAALVATDAPAPIADSSRFELAMEEQYDSALLFQGYDLVIIAAAEGREEEYTVYYDNLDPVSSRAAVLLRSLLSSEKNYSSREGEDSSQIILRPLIPPETAEGRSFLSLILPFMVLIFAVSCPLPIAADLSAGERERGSLEPLLATAASRTAVIVGKEGALILASLASVGAYFLGVYISYRLIPSIAGETTMSFDLDLSQLLILSILTILATALFAALQLLLGTLTRSVREAQLSGMPLLILAMGTVYLAQNSALKPFPLWKLHLPVVNLALMIRTVALDRFEVSQWIVVALWMVVYLLLIIGITIYSYSREKILLH